MSKVKLSRTDHLCGHLHPVAPPRAGQTSDKTTRKEQIISPRVQEKDGPHPGQ